MSKLILHAHPVSSNSHRVRLFLELLGEPYDERLVDLAAGGQRSPAFLALNPNGQAPVLEDGDLVLSESCAILIYLARRAGAAGETWWPSNPADQARVAAWLFFAVNDLHNGVGLARNERSFGIPSGGQVAVARARKALDLLEARLRQRPWLELDRPTLADIAAYPFAAVMSEAGIDPVTYPALAEWVARVEALPRAQPMLRLQNG